ncbi:Omp28-related outer membrane protein [Porphyromonas pogonae]|uniref:Omp28-related outer membrane protein n=1 Tax=Porphyromonas pogonae TaxID=867595 RepID=UPI002E79BF99|nr:Omp28-related outer membrane protein [Porphyromonas pogonae]
MTPKSIYKCISVCLAAMSLSLFVSCGSDNSEPVAPPNPNNGGSVTPNPNPGPVIPDGNGKTNVVGMDFTGQKCPSCPRVINLVNKYSEEFKENFIAVAIHGLSMYSTAPFLTEEGMEYLETLKIFGIPTLAFNNVVVDDLSSKEIHDSLAKAINEKPIIGLGLNVKRTDRKVSIELNSKVIKGQEAAVKDKSFKVLCWVTENNVIGLQTFQGKPQDPNFVHNHVFRGSLNTTWGTDYKLGEIFKLEKELPAKVLAPQNSELVVIVYDAASKKFISAVKAKL